MDPLFIQWIELEYFFFQILQRRKNARLPHKSHSFFKIFMKVMFSADV